MPIRLSSTVRKIDLETIDVLDFLSGDSTDGKALINIKLPYLYENSASGIS
jgi:hypothetical protein